MSSSRVRISIAFLTSLAVPVAGDARAGTKDVDITIVNVQTAAVSFAGEYRMSPHVVVRVINGKDGIRSFGLSSEAGILLLPLPPGRYCYDAFSPRGRALRMVRPSAERCFTATRDGETTIGVSYYE